MVDVQRVHTLDRAARDAISRVRAASAREDGADPLDEASDLALRHHGLDDAALWTVSDSGFALVRGDALDLAVAPTTRNCGFATSLLQAVLSEHDGPLVAWSHGNHPGAAALASGHGFDRLRDLWVMRRPVGVPLPQRRATTAIRAYREADRDELLRVNAAAFAAHPEQGAMDEANLAERMAEPWFDPAGLLVAVEDDRMLGFHWTKRHDPHQGEVYVVGVDPAAQGRGLGRELTLAGLEHLAGEVDREVLLYVEADNAPAVALYTGLGFTHQERDTHVQYRRRGA